MTEAATEEATIAPPGLAGNEEANERILKAIETKFPNAVEESQVYLGELTIFVKPDHLLELMRFLKNDPEMDFKYLSDVSGVDWPDRDLRFEVVYHLLSLVGSCKFLRIKCRLGADEPKIDSVVSVWRAANWHEREAFDMFGIVFKGHPDLRRIYMPQDWDGFPLRKDYPLKGR